MHKKCVVQLYKQNHEGARARALLLAATVSQAYLIDNILAYARR